MFCARHLVIFLYGQAGTSNNANSGSPKDPPSARAGNICYGSFRSVYIRIDQN